MPAKGSRPAATEALLVEITSFRLSGLAGNYVDFRAFLVKTGPSAIKSEKAFLPFENFFVQMADSLIKFGLIFIKLTGFLTEVARSLVEFTASLREMAGFLRELAAIFIKLLVFSPQNSAV